MANQEQQLQQQQHSSCLCLFYDEKEEDEADGISSSLERTSLTDDPVSPQIDLIFEF